VTNFEWYLTVLVELIQMETDSKHGKIIADQLLDVTIRVQAVRSFAVNEMANLISSYPVITSPNSTMYEVLYAAAWIVGEFTELLNKPEETLDILLTSRNLPGHIEAIYTHNIMKLFTHILSKQTDATEMNQLCDVVLKELPYYLSSGDIEVQERANSAFQLVELIKKTVSQNGDMLQDTDELSPSNGEVQSLVSELLELFAGELNPVAAKAQRKVQIPAGLDLDTYINSPPDESSESSQDEDMPIFVDPGTGTTTKHKPYKHELSENEIVKLRENRIIEQSNNPNYLKPVSKKHSKHVNENIEDIPVAEIMDVVPLKISSSEYSMAIELTA
jgi:AP-3 complex subunit delta-1